MAEPAGPPGVGHPLRFTTLAHAGRTILGPLGPDELDAVLDRIPLAAGAHAVDVGCGKGDLLIRLARRGATGEGLDRNPWFLADAARLAREAGVGERLTWTLTTDDEVAIPTPVDVVACVGATNALGGPEHAPRAIRAALRPGGWALVGEGFWERPPEPAWLEEFGIAPDELLDLAGTLGRIEAGGLAVRSTHVATPAGWDAYEADYAAGIERWVATAAADDPDREAFVARSASMRDSYARWRRGSLGFVLVLAEARDARSG